MKDSHGQASSSMECDAESHANPTLPVHDDSRIRSLIGLMWLQRSNGLSDLVFNLLWGQLSIATRQGMLRMA
eukprot:6442510-Amphidinium_carterae.2